MTVEEIYYAESLGHYVMIHLSDKVYKVKMSFNDFLSKLNKSFILTHRSFIVNLKYIERITKTDCILQGELQVPISRSSYKAVNQAFIEYYKGGEL